MDTLTHALSGALLARATWNGRKTRIPLRQQTQIGFLAAAFPDIDYLLQLVNHDFLVYLNYHRGITHSIVLLPVWGFLLAILFSKILRPAADWHSLFVLCCLCLGVHIAGDVITSYGTMIFAPFSDWRASLDLAFIIDLLFTGILLLGLIGSVIFQRKRLAAIIGLAALAAYLGVQSWAHQQALTVGKMAARSNAWRNVEINAIPQPLSPFNWKLIVMHEQHYHVAMVRLYGNEFDAQGDQGLMAGLRASYRLPTNMHWQRRYRYGADQQKATRVRTAWLSDEIADFRRFTRYPVLLENIKSAETCYWFSDLRFMLQGRELSQSFTYGICYADGTDEARLKRFDSSS
jgi:inner membrane protein